MNRYFLGVDGGQSRTTAIIGDESGRVVGIGLAGPTNHVEAAEGRAKFVNAMTACLSAACAQAGLDPSSTRFASACLGFSGGPADKQAILEEILSSDRTIVTHDAMIALAGATAGDPGIITIAGTGSIAFGRDSSGDVARVGGWGFIFGDEGGAFHIVRQALRAALRFEEGWGPPTSLRSVLLEATGARDANDLAHRFYTPEFPRPRIASFSKLVDRAAEQGDAIASEVLLEAARDLASIASAAREQLFEDLATVRIAYVGGVFRSRIILAQFRKLLEREGQNQVAPPIHGPAAGALLEAYRAAGVRCALSNVPEEKP